MTSSQAIICAIAVCVVITCGSLAYGYLQNDESVIDSDSVPDVKPIITPKPSTGTTQGGINMATSGVCGNNLSWNLADDGTLTITGYGNMFDYVPSGGSGIHVPWSAGDIRSVVFVNEYTGITGIGRYAFAQCSNLTSVPEIPDTVTYISEAAFAYTSLAQVTIPDSVTTIGSNAFYGCSSLASVTIGNSVTSIGEYVFYNCSLLASVTIPDSATSIGRYAFFRCFSLASVTIGNSVTSIGNEAFHECTSLASVTIGNSVTAIGDHAFYYCTSLASVTLPDSVTTIGQAAFYHCSSLASVTIPGSITSFGSGAFEYCTALESVTIPDTFTFIKNYAFYGCTSLASVTIGKSVTSIEYDAFYGCSSLATIIIPDSVTSIGENAFNECTKLKTVYNQSSMTFVKGSDTYGCVAKYATTLVQGNATVTLVRATSDPTQGTFDTLSVKTLETVTLPDYTFTTQVSGTNKVTTITHTATGWTEQ